MDTCSKDISHDINPLSQVKLSSKSLTNLLLTRVCWLLPHPFNVLKKEIPLHTDTHFENK